MVPILNSIQNSNLKASQILTFSELKLVFWQPFKILTGIRMVQPIPDWCAHGATNHMTYTIQNLDPELSAFWVSGIRIPTADFRSLNLCVLVVVLNSTLRSYNFIFRN